MLKDKLFSDLTTLQIGGPIKLFIEAKTDSELIEAINSAKEENIPYLIIGTGSNLLVSDEGFEGLVIKNSIQGVINRGQIIEVKSGTVLQDLVDYANENGLSGLEKLAGIPGTVGGAVYGNAGAYGQTISDHISSLVILSEAKDLKTLTKNECKFNYRDSIFKQTKNIILEVTFELEKGDSETLKKESLEIIEKRLAKYPKGIKCPGSFFKNIVAESLPEEVLKNIPEEKIMYGKIPAGTLLEDVGAKGEVQGAIEIAPYHANLFVNNGGGKASDFYELAKKVKIKIKEKFGINLEPEVQLINLPIL